MSLHNIEVELDEHRRVIVPVEWDGVWLNVKVSPDLVDEAAVANDLRDLAECIGEAMIQARQETTR